MSLWIGEYAKVVGTGTLFHSPAGDFTGTVKEANVPEPIGPDEPLERGDRVADKKTGAEHVIAETSFLMLRLEGETDWQPMAGFRKIHQSRRPTTFAAATVVIAGTIIARLLA